MAREEAIRFGHAAPELGAVALAVAKMIVRPLLHRCSSAAAELGDRRARDIHDVDVLAGLQSK